MFVCDDINWNAYFLSIKDSIHSDVHGKNPLSKNWARIIQIISKNTLLSEGSFKNPSGKFPTTERQPLQTHLQSHFPNFKAYYKNNCLPQMNLIQQVKSPEKLQTKQLWGKINCLPQLNLIQRVKRVLENYKPSS